MVKEEEKEEEEKEIDRSKKEKKRRERREEKKEEERSFCSGNLKIKIKQETDGKQQEKYASGFMFL